MAGRRERGLKQLPDGRWQWCYQDPGGSLRRHIARTKSEARMYLEKTRTEMREGRYLDRRKNVHTPLEEGIQEFLKWSKTNTRPDTYRNDTYYSKRWKAFPKFKGRSLDQIGAADVEAYKADRVATVKPKTVDNDLARMKRMFSVCITLGLCEKNPVKAVKFFKPESRRDRFLAPEEETALLEKAPPHIHAAIIFSINTGLRLGEMLSLTWGQVDTKREEITVTAEKAKGKRSRRVPLNARAKAALETLPRAIKTDALVFARFRGNYAALRKPWEKAVKEAEIHGVCWHTLRHTFASRLVMAGADLVTVQRLLGHTTLAMVLKYAHLAEPHLRNAVTLLDSNLQFTCNPPQPGFASGSSKSPVSPLD